MSAVEPNRVVLEQAAHGQRSMLLLQVLKLACKFISVLLLARLVTPNDHGLFAMAASVVLLLALFRDGGLAAAAVQARDLAPTQLTTLFWAHLSIGFLLTLLTLAAAPVAAAFYANAAVIPLLLPMSGSFLLIGAGGFARNQLERASRFGEISWLEGIAAILGTLATIGAALAGAGAYSFVVYLLVSEALATLLAWRCLQWRPKGTPLWSSLRDLFRTGVHVMGYQLIVYFVQQIDGILVGRYFGAHTLGLYNRANQLLALPNLYVATPLNQVALVTLSRLGRTSQDFVRHACVTATVITHLILPLFAICILLPEETVRLVLGAQWPDAAPLLRLLAVAAAAATVTSLGYAINVAANQTGRLVISAACALPLTAAAVWLGVQRGSLGVAQSIAAVHCALLAPRLWWALRDLPSGFRAYLRALVGPVVCMAAAMVGLWLGSHLVYTSAWPLRLALGVTGEVIAIGVMCVISPSIRLQWTTVLGYLPLPFRRSNG